MTDVRAGMKEIAMNRPYPWKCHTCREVKVRPVVTDYSAAMEHDGRVYQVVVDDLEILECEACLTRVLPDAAHDRLEDKLREQAGLLTPGQIRRNREALGLSVKELANRLAVAEPTVARWESGGQIPPSLHGPFSPLLLRAGLRSRRPRR